MLVLLGLLVFAGYVLGIAGFFLALSQSGKVDAMQERLRILQDTQRRLLGEIDVLRVDLRRAPGGETGKPEAAPDAKSEAVPAAPGVVATPAPIAVAAAVEPTPVKPPAATAEKALSVPQISTAAPKGARTIGFEERMGTRWSVWVGGIALALGGLLLVRYSIEQGIFGPGVRVMLGAVLAAALAGAGEWLRRTDAKLPIDTIPSAYIPGVLTAAGTIAAFGTIYAAHALHGFIGAAGAFTLLGAVGLAAMLAASVHGPALAGLGLAGSFATPLLVSSATPNPWPVVLFLGVVAAAAHALATAKRWSWLSVAAAIGAMLWGLVMIAEAAGSGAWIAPAMLHAALQLLLAGYFLVGLPDVANADEAGKPDFKAVGVLAGLAAVGVGVLIVNGGVSPASVTFAGLLIAILAAAGLRSVPVAPAIAVAGAVVLAKMFIWPSAYGSRLDLGHFTTLFTEPLNPAGYAAFALNSALAVAALSGFRLFASPRLKAWSAGTYAATAAVLPCLALALAHLRMTGFERSLVFSLLALALAGLFAFAAGTFQASERKTPTPAVKLGTGAFAAAAVAAVALALVFYLDRGYLTVALAVAAFATAYMADLKGIPALRSAVVALGVAVLARVIWDPRIMGEAIGTTPIFNWLLFGYGVPALAFFASARVLEKTAKDKASGLSDALALVFAGLLAFFEIRHLLHGGDVFAAHTDHVELGLMLLVALGFAYALMRSGIGRGNVVFQTASLVYGGISALVTVFGLLISQNPFFVDDPVRSFGPVNSLWLAYLAPAIAAALLARHARGRWPALITLGVAALALALLFTFVSLEVRHAYHGESLVYWHATNQAEFWSYSAAWLLLGIGLLGYGLWREMPEARLASAAIVVLTVLKVFLWDMSDLEGAWRAFSFIGLGLVLVGIGLVYQRLVFAPDSGETQQPKP